MRFPAGLPALPQQGLHRRRSRVPRSLQRSPGTPWSASAPSSTTPVQRAGQLGQEFQFATHERIRLKPETHNDWTDNLIGAQYLEMPKNSRTTVTLRSAPCRWTATAPG